jgi:hypothetical protein
MYLKIVLTILVINLSLISFGIYFWWKKYGKMMFEMIQKLQTMNNPKNMGKSSLQNLGEMMKQINQAMSKLKK